MYEHSVLAVGITEESVIDEVVGYFKKVADQFIVFVLNSDLQVMDFWFTFFFLFGDYN